VATETTGWKGGVLISRTDWIVIGLIVLAGLGARLIFAAFTVDDAYITLRYAENLAHGNGFVFNVGERVYGTTTPLFAAMLAILSILTRHALIVGKLVNIISDVAVAVLLFFMARRISRLAWVAYLAGFLYAMNPVTAKWSASGMETGLYTLLICLALWSHGRQRCREGYICAGLAILTRIDGVFVFGALLAADLFSRRRAALYDALIGGLPVVIWSIFAILYFGSPIPHSAIAKKITYGGTSSITVLGQVLDKFAFRAGLLTLAGLVPAILGMVWGVGRYRWGRVMLGWWFCYWGFFILTGSRLHGWYLAPPIWLYALCLAVGLGLIVHWVARRMGRLSVAPGVRAVAAVAAVVVVLGVTGGLLVARYSEVRQQIGMAEKHVGRPVGLWLAEHGAPGDTVCAESIGAIGYYSGLYVLDLVGLVSPQVLKFNRERASGPNFGAIIQQFKPQFYVWWESWEQQWWNAHPAMKLWLETHYEKKAVFSFPGSKGWAIWERR
jgi:arabinofuranosyltransferase